MFDNINLFVKVVENKGFNKTAELEHISNSTLSRKIKELEDYLNKQLIIRNTRNFKITPAGQELYLQFKDIEPRLNKFLDAQKTTNKTQRINVALPIVLSLEMFTPFLSEFLINNPDIELNILYRYRGVLDLKENNIDIAVSIFNNENSKSYNQRLAFCEDVKLYCTPKYAERFGIPKNIEELASHKIIGGFTNFGEHIAVVSLDSDKVKSIDLNQLCKIHVTNIIHALKIGLSGHHIFPYWSSFTKQKVTNGDLVPILPEMSFYQADYYIISKRGISPAAQRVIDFLDECINRNSVTQNMSSTVSGLLK